MASHTAISINDNFTSGQPGIAHGAACDKTTSGVNKKLGVAIEQMSGNNRLDDMIDDILANLLLGDIVGMLS